MFPKRIVVIGGSSAEGKVDPDHGGFVGLLRKWREGVDQRNHVFNLGVSGDTSQGVKERLLNECRVRRPHLIICQVGGNDSLHVGSPQSPCLIPLQQFEANLRAIIDDARSIADIMFVGLHPIDESTTTPVFWGEFYYMLDDIKAYAEVIKKVCLEKEVPYIDMLDAWMAIDYKKYLHTDGLHANAEGHAYIFEKIKTKLMELYKE